MHARFAVRLMHALNHCQALYSHLADQQILSARRLSLLILTLTTMLGLQQTTHGLAVCLRKQESPAVAAQHDKPARRLKSIIRATGHSRASKVTTFDSLHMVSYYRRIVTLCLECTVFEIWRHIGRKSPKKPTYFHLARSWGDFLRIFDRVIPCQKLES